MAYRKILCYEAQVILKDIGIHFHSTKGVEDSLTVYYSVKGTNGLLEVDKYSLKFDSVKVQYFGSGKDRTFKQINAARMMKLYIEEYRKREAEKFMGAYI